MTDKEKVSLCDRLIEQLHKEATEALNAERFGDLQNILMLIGELEKKKGEIQ